MKLKISVLIAFTVGITIGIGMVVYGNESKPAPTKISAVAETVTETTSAPTTTTFTPPTEATVTTTTAATTVPTTTTTTTTPVTQPTQPSGNYLECVKLRESGGNYNAVNSSSGAGGAYQFLQETWDNTAVHAGRPDLVGTHPSNANPSDQDAMANHLLSWYGPSPWAGPGC